MVKDKKDYSLSLIIRYNRREIKRKTESLTCTKINRAWFKNLVEVIEDSKRKSGFAKESVRT